MRARRFVCFLIVALAVSRAANADYHNADANSRASNSNGGSSLNGFGLGFIKEMNCPKDAKGQPIECKRSMWGFGGDVSAQFGSHDTKPETEVTFLGVARYTMPKEVERWDRGLFYAQAFLGGTTKNDGIAHHTNWATGLGIAADICLKNPPGDNPNHHAPVGWAIRAQLDYIRDLGGDQKVGGEQKERNVRRVGLGLTYRFDHAR